MVRDVDQYARFGDNWLSFCRRAAWQQTSPRVVSLRHLIAEQLETDEKRQEKENTVSPQRLVQQAVKCSEKTSPPR